MNPLPRVFEQALGGFKPTSYRISLSTPLFTLNPGLNRYNVGLIFISYDDDDGLKTNRHPPLGPNSNS